MLVNLSRLKKIEALKEITIQRSKILTMIDVTHVKLGKHIAYSAKPTYSR